MTTYWCESAWLTGGFARRVRLGRAGRPHQGRPRRGRRRARRRAPRGRHPARAWPTRTATPSTARCAAASTAAAATSGAGASRCMPPPSSSTPTLLRPRAGGVRRDGAGRASPWSGEFHYVHHRPGGKPYGDPNAMGLAVRQAADEAGIRLTLLDTCYLEGGLNGGGHVELHPGQRRFSDGTVDAWAERDGRPTGPRPTGCASARRSTPCGPCRREDLPQVVAARRRRCPLHVHLSEQHGENLACQMFYGRTPTELLDEAGALGSNLTSVHATHLTEHDIELLGGTGTGACICPTTERDLADGIGPAAPCTTPAARSRSAPTRTSSSTPSSSCAGIEMHERLVTQRARPLLGQRPAPGRLLQRLPGARLVGRRPPLQGGPRRLRHGAHRHRQHGRLGARPDHLLLRRLRRVDRRRGRRGRRQRRPAPHRRRGSTARALHRAGGRRPCTREHPRHGHRRADDQRPRAR